LLRATDVWNNHISKKDRQRIQNALIQLATTAEIDKYVTELRQRRIDRLTLRFVGDEWLFKASEPERASPMRGLVAPYPALWPGA
jgi:hypothetical protein